ncbi:MAG: alpha/beta hydrolase [Oscillospiraceae bacterium]|jgi:alpha-beta hydrolase superfamily lysophospholipase|nr:alpha/beta hydrolase [Oscillospiraceae bacterium]
MNLTKKQGTFPSSSGIATIHYRVWSPVEAPRAAVQIVHGMAEYAGRYEDFARALCAEGFAVWAMDLLGHGDSATEDERGYFGPEDGWQKLRRDIKTLTNRMRESYPPEVPIFLFGHSMGSFLARAYAERYSDDLAGAIFCGTSGPNPAATAGVLMTRLVIAVKGKEHRSPLLNSVAFGYYNDKYPGKPRTPFDWLNSDPAEVDRYIADARCGFLFTAAGYLDLMQLLKSVNRRAWFQSLPHQFPMLLIAGEQDPVGAFGKGVQLVARQLRDAGKKKTACHIFPGMRHEILLEPDRQQVYDVVIAWLHQNIEKQ